MHGKSTRNLWQNAPRQSGSSRRAFATNARRSTHTHAYTYVGLATRFLLRSFNRLFDFGLLRGHHLSHLPTRQASRNRVELIERSRLISSSTTARSPLRRRMVSQVCHCFPADTPHAYVGIVPQDGSDSGVQLYGAGGR